jgi:hypothetical protein
LLKVVYVGCAEVPGCVRGWWLVLLLIVWQCECEKVITNVADENACLCFCAWAVGEYVTDEREVVIVYFRCPSDCLQVPVVENCVMIARYVVISVKVQ